jgi:hypothetical protein
MVNLLRLERRKTNLKANSKARWRRKSPLQNQNKKQKPNQRRESKDSPLQENLTKVR